MKNHSGDGCVQRELVGVENRGLTDDVALKLRSEGGAGVRQVGVWWEQGASSVEGLAWAKVKGTLCAEESRGKPGCCAGTW